MLPSTWSVFNEPPDIDVDFEHEPRKEIIQYIYQKYGRHRAALTAGKALGMDFEQMNRLSSAHQWWDGRKIISERLQEHGLDPARRPCASC